jgi:hypothetical protein
MSWKSILKAKKVEKDLNPYDWIIPHWNKWLQETRAASGSALGINPSNSTSLFQILYNHGKAKRKGTSGGKVTFPAWRAIVGMFKVTKKGTLEKADSKEILKWLSYLERMEGSDGSNPANIKYTHPAKTVKTAKGKRKKSTEKVEWFGHYYNSHYRTIQTELGNKVLPAIAEDWAKPSPNEAKPPMWQALFSGGQRGKSSDNLVTNGLLTILEEYRDYLKKAVKE